MAPSERARLAFALYVNLGPRRSLDKLHRVLADHGIDVGIATLKRWSTRYDWQTRLADLDDQADLALDASNIRARVEMLERQSGLGRALQGLGGSALHKLMGSPARVDEIGPREITSLIETGARLEAGTSAEARNRRDIAIQMANRLLVALVSLFDDLNTSANTEERRRRFAVGLDDILSSFVTDQEDGHA